MSYSRLASTLSSGKSTITIRDSDTQWEEGDEIVIAASNYFQKQSEVFMITAISGTSITLNTTAEYNHYGSSKIYGSYTDIGSIDLAAEVGLLSHNVKIKGSYTGEGSDWGGQVLVPLVDLGSVETEGTLDLYGVEFINMGQYEISRAGISFSSVTETRQTVSNCSFHSSNGFWMSLDGSRYVDVMNNVFYEGVGTGIVLEEDLLDSSFSNNLFLYVKNTTQDGSSVTDVSSLFYWTSLTSTPNDQSIEITNNIFADADIGLIVPGAKCDSSQENLVTGNTFHSGQVGMLVLDSQDSSNCVYVSDAKAYKLTEDGVIAYTESTKIIAESMIFVANKNGLTLNQGSGSIESDSFTFSIKKCVFIGYTNLNDADESDISGFRIPLTSQEAKGVIPSLGDFPYFKQSTQSVFGGKLTVEECIVKNHGYIKNITLMQSNYFAAEGSALVYLKDSSFSNTVDGDLVYFSEEKYMDCALGLNCTGYSNILISVSGFLDDDDFDIIPYASQSKPHGNYSECTKELSWVGYKCYREGNLTEGYVLLNFKSLDEDSLTRDFSPVYLEREEHEYEVVLNSGNEWFANDLFKSWVRESSFQAILPAGAQFQLSSTESYPKNSIYFLKSPRSEYKEIILEILMETTQFIRVKANGVTMATSLEDQKIEIGSSELFCGMNSYQSDSSSMLVVLTTDCEVELSLDYYVKASLTFETEIYDFFDNFGIQQFIETLINFFQISSENFEVSSVEEGSTVINFVYLYNSDSDTLHQTLQEELYIAALKGLIDFKVSYGTDSEIVYITEEVIIYHSDVVYETEEIEVISEVYKTGDIPVWTIVLLSIMGCLNVWFCLILIIAITRWILQGRNLKIKRGTSMPLKKIEDEPFDNLRSEANLASAQMTKKGMGSPTTNFSVGGSPLKKRHSQIMSQEEFEKGESVLIVPSVKDNTIDHHHDNEMNPKDIEFEEQTEPK